MKFLSTFFLVLAIYLPTGHRAIMAQTPATEPAIKTNAGVANEVVDVSQSDACSKDVDSCILRFLFSGGMKATDLKRPSFTLLTSMFSGLAQLMPWKVKSNTIPKNILNNYTSGWASLYVKDPSSGQEHCIPASAPYVSDPIPLYSRLDQDSRQVSSLMTRYSLSGKGGNYDMREKAVEIAQAPPCTVVDQGSVIESNDAGIKTEGGNFASLIISFLKQVFEGAQAGERVEAKIYSKQADNYMGRDYCLVAGCSGETVDLSYVQGEDNESQRVAHSGGIARTFSPASHDPKGGNTHGESDSQFTIEVSGKGDTQVDTRTVYTKATECSADYMARASLPMSLQDKYVPKKPECAFVKPSQSSTNQHSGRPGQEKGGKDICAIANQYKVPCGFLKGIWEIETGSSRTIPTGTYGNLSCCNSVAACGPMQIRGGLLPTIAGNKRLNLCTESDGFEAAARLLLYKKCLVTTGCVWDPNNLPDISIREDELYVTGYYYGTDGCFATTETQMRWGKGVSYCDAVEYHMKNGTLPVPQ